MVIGPVLMHERQEKRDIKFNSPEPPDTVVWTDHMSSDGAKKAVFLVRDPLSLLGSTLPWLSRVRHKTLGNTLNLELMSGFGRGGFSPRGGRGGGAPSGGRGTLSPQLLFLVFGSFPLPPHPKNIFTRLQHNATVSLSR
jgi:hypothetical protein